MSKTLFSFMINELKVIRLICPNPKCGTVSEIPIHSIQTALTLQCPSCKAIYEDSHGVDGPIRQLAKSIQTLSANTSMGIEFVLPVEE